MARPRRLVARSLLPGPARLTAHVLLDALVRRDLPTRRASRRSNAAKERGPDHGSNDRTSLPVPAARSTPHCSSRAHGRRTRAGSKGWVAVEMHAIFDESEIRAAEHRLEAALVADDRTAWVLDYTEDAVFDGGGEHAVVGRESLRAMAKSMRPMESVSIRPLRTEGRGGLAVVWIEASWISGPAETEPTTVNVRGMILWRKEPDGAWRVAMEHIG